MKIDSLMTRFIENLGTFSHRLSSLDRVWDVLFPDERGAWHHVNVVQYRKTYYVVHIDGDCPSVAFEFGKPLQGFDSMNRPSPFLRDEESGQACEWEALIVAALRWLKCVRRDWMKAGKRVYDDYPLNRRYGMVSGAVVRDSLPGLYRVDRELGVVPVRRFVNLVDDGYFLGKESSVVPSLTASRYFEYCRIAYLAGREKGESVDASMSGRELYIRYADGRHQGLLDIDPDSEREFADWIDGVHPKHSLGGHPWEIKRGGNTTHIDLSVYRPYVGSKEGFQIELRGESISRMVETIRMFLAIHDAKLPITIANPEGVRKRLLGQDVIGLVPGYASLHRANQRFRGEEKVFDVMYYDDLKRFKRRILPFITWEPLPLLKPR